VLRHIECEFYGGIFTNFEFEMRSFPLLSLLSFTLNFKLRLDEFADAHIGQQREQRKERKVKAMWRNEMKIPEGVGFYSICRLFVLFCTFIHATGYINIFSERNQTTLFHLLFNFLSQLSLLKVIPKTF
jgi:hypothetical protein